MSRLLLVMILIQVLPPILAKTENWPVGEDHVVMDPR